MGKVSHSVARQGFWTPFTLVAIGIYLLITMPNFSELVPHTGIIDHFIYDGKKSAYITLQGNNSPYIINYKPYKKILSESINNNRTQNIIIWTEKNEKTALQVAIDGKMVYYFDLSSDKRLGWIFIIIGGILIPIVIYIRVKYRHELDD